MLRPLPLSSPSPSPVLARLPRYLGLRGLPHWVQLRLALAHPPSLRQALLRLALAHLLSLRRALLRLVLAHPPSLRRVPSG